MKVKITGNIQPLEAQADTGAAESQVSAPPEPVPMQPVPDALRDSEPQSETTCCDRGADWNTVIVGSALAALSAAFFLSKMTLKRSIPA